MAWAWAWLAVAGAATGTAAVAGAATGTAAVAGAVPRIGTVPFAEWHRLASAADDRPHPAPAFTQRLARRADGEPQGGHIGLGRTGADAVVSWFTLGPDAPAPAVEFGEDPDDLDRLAVSDDVRSYTRDDMCGAEGDMGGHAYHVYLSELRPATTYYYRFGSRESDRWSAVRRITTPGAPGSREAAEGRFLLFGDHGYFDSSQRVHALLETEVGWAQQLLLLADLSYSDGEAVDGVDFYWDEFQRQAEPYATEMFYHVMHGNHEAEKGECSVPYNARYQMPFNGEPDEAETSNYWYSFAYGPVFFLQMSTEIDFSRGSDQFAFLERQLKQVDRSLTPWVVFSGHKPMYSALGVGSGEFLLGMQSELEGLLVEHGVDLALWAHVHNYQRAVCTVAAGECVDFFDDENVLANAGAPLHMVIGMAGRSFESDANRHPDEWLDGLGYEVVFKRELGYTRMMANMTALTMEFVEESKGDGRVTDSFTLVKDRDQSRAFSVIAIVGIVAGVIGVAVGGVLVLRRRGYQRMTE